MVLTLRLYVVYETQDKQQHLSFTTLAEWFYITEVEIVHWAVRTESIHKTDSFLLHRFYQGSDDNAKFSEIRALYMTCVFI
jgi:hypothetical protein